MHRTQPRAMHTPRQSSGMFRKAWQDANGTEMQARNHRIVLPELLALVEGPAKSLRPNCCTPPSTPQHQNYFLLVQGQSARCIISKDVSTLLQACIMPLNTLFELQEFGESNQSWLRALTFSASLLQEAEHACSFPTLSSIFHLQRDRLVSVSLDTGRTVDQAIAVGLTARRRNLKKQYSICWAPINATGDSWGLSNTAGLHQGLTDIICGGRLRHPPSSGRLTRCTDCPQARQYTLVASIARGRIDEYARFANS